MSVKVMDLTDLKNPSHTFSFADLKGPALSVSLCPNATLLAVSSGDGMLRVWNLESQAIVKGLECVPKANSFMNADLLCKFAII